MDVAVTFDIDEGDTSVSVFNNCDVGISFLSMTRGLRRVLMLMVVNLRGIHKVEFVLLQIREPLLLIPNEHCLIVAGQRGNSRIITGCLGRNVIFGCNSIGKAGTKRGFHFWASVASESVPSIHAKASPMHWRDPPPKGK